MSPPSRSEDIWKTSSVGDNKLTATKSVADSTCRIHVPPRTGEQQCLSMRLRPKKLQSSSGLDEGGFVFIESFLILISLALEWGDLARPADLGLFPATQVAVSQTFKEACPSTQSQERYGSLLRGPCPLLFLVGTTRLHPLLLLIFLPLGLAQLGSLLLRCPRMGPQLTGFHLLYHSSDLTSCLLHCGSRNPLRSPGGNKGER